MWYKEKNKEIGINIKHLCQKETLTLVCIICYDFFEVDLDNAMKFVRCEKCREQGKLLD